MAEIVLKNICKEYGKKTAVSDLNLEVKDKELVVFLGPSGCGKTTTLNMIAGIDEPTSGKLFFDGEDVTSLPAHVRNVAMVFQSATLYPHLTSYENIRMSLRIMRLGKEEKDKKIKEVANLLSINEFLNRFPGQLSGGERQRVATAKAIIRNPRVFLMDEPLSGLDAALRESLRGELVLLQKRLGVTMVFVTHDQVEAMTLGDRIVVMNHGVLQQMGPPDDIYNHPVNTFVASFVGTPPMNLFEGRLERISAQTMLFKNEILNIELPRKLIDKLEGSGRTQKEAILGCRPQDLTLRFGPSLDRSVGGRVYNIEKLGKESVVTIEYAANQQKIKVLVPGIFQGGLEQSVAAVPQPEHVFLFDRQTGASLVR